MESTLSIVESRFIVRAMNESAALGKLIDDAMRAAGVAGYQLAAKLGKQPSWVSRLINGQMQNPPTPEELTAISSELGISRTSMLQALGYLEDRELGGETLSSQETAVLSALRSIPDMTQRDVDIILAQFEWLRKAKSGAL